VAKGTGNYIVTAVL